MIKIKLKNKKGSIGETLNWTVAFIIIVSLMFFYIVMAGFIAGKKIVTFEDENKISYNSIASANSLRILNSVLMEEINLEGQKINIEDGIKQWALLKQQGEENEANELEKEIIPQIGKVIGKYYGDCNVFYFSGEGEKFAINKIAEDYEGSKSSYDEKFEYEKSRVKSKLDKISPLVIYAVDNPIEIKFYNSDKSC